MEPVEVHCDPPLGQTTILPHGTEKVSFFASINLNEFSVDEPWEAVVWHNFQSETQWTGTSLQSYRDSSIVCIQDEMKCFVLKTKPAIYSVKRKPTYSTMPSHEKPWIWANHDSKNQDGEIILQGSLPPDSQDVLPGLQNMKHEKVPNDVAETNLWHCSHNIEPAGQKSAYSLSNLGLPTKQVKFLALTRLWTPWIVPQHGSSVFNISRDSIMVALLRSDGFHVVLLAINGLHNVSSVIQASADGSVIIQSRNDDSVTRKGDVLLSIGGSFNSALTACMQYARRMLSNFETTDTEKLNTGEADDGEASVKWYKEWWDGLTYCTWNGIGVELSEAKILEVLDDLKKSDIQIMNLIIDDNWQSIDQELENHHDRGWLDFEANPKGFPDGLSHSISRIKQKSPQLQTIAVWHTILGYWAGIAPQGKLARRYKIRKVRRSVMPMPNETHPESDIYVIDEPDVQRFYNDFYGFLESCGINGVKTDGQFLLDQMADPEDRRELSKTYQDAWKISGLRNFQSKRISCMSQVPEIMFYSQLLTNQPRVTVRNSDDYFPDVPESHPWHIFSNAYTSLLTQHLNVVPDWDMFQTAHPYGSFHAAARCISGGPVYFTDIPGEHDKDLLNQLVVQTTQGETVTLRPNQMAKVVSEQAYVSYEQRKALKLANFNRANGSNVGFVGVFNISDHPISDFVSLRQFLGIEPDQEYIVQVSSSGELTAPMSGKHSLPIASVHLQHRGWDLLTAHPLYSAEHIDTKVAALGLMGKITGAAATLRFEVEALQDRRLKVTTAVKALGVLGLYVSDLERRNLAENFLITLLGETIPFHTVKVSEKSPKVLLIDMATAWKELGMHAGWGNEVIVTAYMS